MLFHLTPIPPILPSYVSMNMLGVFLIHSLSCKYLFSTSTDSLELGRHGVDGIPLIPNTQEHGGSYRRGIDLHYQLLSVPPN